MSKKSLKMVVATVLVACAAAVMPQVAVASPGGGPVIGGDAQVPLQGPRLNPKPFIDFVKKIFPTKAPAAVVPPKPPATTWSIWMKTFRENQVVDALKRLASKKGVSETVKWATCEALEANVDYTADYDGWVYLIASYVPEDLRESALQSDFVMSLVAAAVHEVASPLSELTSHWTGPFYASACS